MAVLALDVVMDADLTIQFGSHEARSRMPITYIFAPSLFFSYSVQLICRPVSEVYLALRSLYSSLCILDGVESNQVGKHSLLSKIGEEIV